MNEATKMFIEALGLDLSDPNLKETPERVAKMYEILLGGYEANPTDYLKTFPAKSDDMVTLTNIPLYSFCSHHLLPFVGKIHIAYIPGEKVVGISKLVRFARIYAKRLNLQEDMTQNIADTLMDFLGAKGVMVKVEATHMCMVIRGVRSHSAVMVTSAKRGQFKTDPALQAEFNNSIKNAGVYAY